jgi:hypothetical protein
VHIGGVAEWLGIIAAAVVVQLSVVGVAGSTAVGVPYAADDVLLFTDDVVV